MAVGLIQGCAAVQEVQEQAQRMGNHAAPGINNRSGSEGPSAGKGSGPPSTHRQKSPKDATAKQAALLLPQAGRNGEELQQMLNFRPFAFFYPSPFPKYLVLVTVPFRAKFLQGAKWMCFSSRGQLCPSRTPRTTFSREESTVKNQWVCTEI